MNQTVDSIRHMDERYADRCRRSLGEEQARSLAETDGWAHVDKGRVHTDWMRCTARSRVPSMAPGPKTTGPRS